MINWKIDIADLFNMVLIIAGGVLGYLLLDRYQEQDSRFRVIEALADNVKQISPGLDFHYTNVLAEDGDKLKFKVYIKNLATHDVWIGPPELKYQSGQAKAETVSMEDVYGFQNLLAPGVDLCLEFERKMPAKGTQNVSLGFKAEVLPAYTQTLLLAVNELSDTEVIEDLKQSIEQHSSKLYRFEEQLNAAGANPDWPEFCEHHRRPD